MRTDVASSLMTVTATVDGNLPIHDDAPFPS
jgi:hypothetical protein